MSLRFESEKVKKIGRGTEEGGMDLEGRIQ